MKKNKVLFWIFILCITNSIFLNAQSNNIRAISDSISYPSTYYETKKAEPWERNVHFIGKNDVQYEKILIKKIENLSIPVQNNLTTERDVNNFESNSVSLKVDTNQKVTLSEFEWWTNERKYKYYKSYPIILRNLSKDKSLTIGYGWTTEIYLQAQKEDGKWIDVELPYSLSCNFGAKSIYLKPNEFAVVLGIIYKGDYSTKLRYRFGKFYSNEFKGRINKSQLTDKDFLKYRK